MPAIQFTDPKSMSRHLSADAKAIHGRIVAAIQKTVLEGEAIAQQEIDNTVPKPVDTATYRRGFQYARLPDGATIYNPVPYASVIEYGRRPGKGISKEGMDALAGWVYRKGLAGRSGPREDRMAAARRVAYVVARKIRARGLPAKHVLLRTMHRLTPKVREAVGRAVAAVT